MDFTNSPPEWQNNGEEPSQSLKESGFTPGYKPPAAYFNWFWSKVSACITELQNKLLDVNTSKAEANIKKNPDDTTGDIIETHLTVGSRKAGSTIGEKSFAQGGDITASGVASHAEGGGTTASGNHSHAEGYDTTASIIAAHAEGYSTTASAMAAHAEGYSTTASGSNAHAEGSNTTASRTDAHAEGNGTKATGMSSHAEGFITTAAGDYSHAEGFGTKANGLYSHAGGYYTTAKSNHHVIGHFNKDGTTASSTGTSGDAFIIGNGNDSANSNAFRVAYNGSVYGAGAYNSTGADIAELYEWLDGNPDNEDRRGLFVTLDGTKIKLAEPTDTYIKGVISAAPALVGDSYSDTWHGMYLTDVFRVPLKQTVHHDAEYMEVKKIDPETGEEITEQVLVHDEYDAKEYILNPNYDPKQEYIPREQRQEYDYVSSWGKLVIVDDGTCEVNGFATVGEGGKATKSGTQTVYRVMERKDETHIFVAIG